MSETLRLAETLCARLCHDLAGPLGALIGVMEIAREEYPDSETVAVGEQTAVDLGQRLKLLRAAWGGDVEDLDVARLRGFVETLSSGRRLQVDLSGLQEGAVFPAQLGRLVLNLLLLAADSLPAGGIIVLSGAVATGLLLTIAGPRAAWLAGFIECLVEGPSASDAAFSDARRIQAPLTALLARGSGYRLSVLVPVGASSEAIDAPPLLLSTG